MENIKRDLHQLSMSELREVEKHQAIEIEKRGITEILYCKYFDAYLMPHPPMWTISFLVEKKTGDALSRGISIMSPLDNLRRIEGRVRARGRALRAIKIGRNSAPIKVRADNAMNPALIQAAVDFEYKSMYKPYPTSLEAQIIADILDE
jgi:hypothetical protein